MTSESSEPSGTHGLRMHYMTSDHLEEMIRLQVAPLQAEERLRLEDAAEPEGPPPSLQVEKMLRSEAWTRLRGQDLLLGQLAIRAKRATDTQIRRALRMQEVAYEKGGTLPRRLGEILVGSRILTSQHLADLLELQTRLRALEAEDAGASAG